MHDNSCVLHSVVESAVVIGSKSVVEYCTLQGGSSIGSGCILSNLTLPVWTENTFKCRNIHVDIFLCSFFFFFRSLFLFFLRPMQPYLTMCLYTQQPFKEAGCPWFLVWPAWFIALLNCCCDVAPSEDLKKKSNTAKAASTLSFCGVQLGDALSRLGLSVAQVWPEVCRVLVFVLLEGCLYIYIAFQGDHLQLMDGPFVPSFRDYGRVCLVCSLRGGCMSWHTARSFFF